MITNWQGKRNILCIRLDNMGDVLMSTPAFRALKESFGCKLTLLTSSMAAGIAPFVGVDAVIVADVPWVRSDKEQRPDSYLELVAILKLHQFDAAVVFTVFSQNPMPAIMLAYLAGIPDRLAYCRENPYGLLTAWVPDQEPYTLVKHQVVRDLELVAAVGATVQQQDLQLNVPSDAYPAALERLKNIGVDPEKPWMIVHACASEAKRAYPLQAFRQIVTRLANENIQLVFTGVEKERAYIDSLIGGIEKNVFVLAGALTLEVFMALVDLAPVLLSVNTGPVHIAAALKTPVIVLYALTNPQHMPWLTQNVVFTYPVPEALKSRNEVLKYVAAHILENKTALPDGETVIRTVISMLQTASPQPVPPAKDPDASSNL